MSIRRMEVSTYQSVPREPVAEEERPAAGVEQAAVALLSARGSAPQGKARAGGQARSYARESARRTSGAEPARGEEEDRARLPCPFRP